MTYALARKIGIARGQAEIISWANQHTDDLTKAELHGLQTQSASLGNWKDRQIQLTVLVAFHFLPGDDRNNFWVVTPHSSHSQILVEAALIDPIRLGIALHTLQDSFSHQGFTGWEEPFNACFAWDNLWSAATPNVGHADMQRMPDMVNITWTDPRTGQIVNNQIRAYQAAKATWNYLAKYYGKEPLTQWPDIELQLRQIFGQNTGKPSVDYDKRKEALVKLSGDKILRHSRLTKRMENRYKIWFIQAARKQLATVMELIKDLPGPT